MHAFLFHSMMAMSAFFVIFYTQRILLRNNSKRINALLVLVVGSISLYLVLVLGLNQLSGALQDVLATFVFLGAMIVQFLGLRKLKELNGKSELRS